MQRICLCLLFLTGYFCVKSQDKPDFLPSTITESALNLHNMCKPGVKNKSKSKGIEISYKYTTSSIFDHGDEGKVNPSVARSIQYFKVKLNVPLLLKPGFNIIAGYGFEPEIYRFGEINEAYENPISSIHNDRLKTNAFSLTMTKSWNHKLYSIFRFKTSFSGNYDGWIKFDQQYVSYNAIGMIGIKRNDLTEIAAGISYSKSLGRNSIFPFLVFNKTFSDHWGLETVLPGKIMGRHNFNDKSIMLFGAEYSSSKYSINTSSAGTGEFGIYNLNHSAIKASLSYERQLVPWVWTSMKVGYQKNFNLAFNQVSGMNNSFEVQPSNQLYFSVGFFLSPPDDFMK